MHTSKILRSDHFHVVDDREAPANLTAGLTAQDRLGIVSPRYEDGILGASAAILAFVTAFYDLQRAQEAASGEPFFIYADYFAFLFGDAAAVRGRAQPAPLKDAVSAAYGQLDVWPDEKWVVVPGVAELWAQLQSRGITHLLLPAQPDVQLGPVPATIRANLKATYRYLLPGEQSPGATWRIELAGEPLEVIAKAIAYLPAESPAHSYSPAAYQQLILGA